MLLLDRFLFLYSLLYSGLVIGGGLISGSFYPSPGIFILLLPLPGYLISQLIPPKGLATPTSFSHHLIRFKSKLKHPFVILSMGLYFLALITILTKIYLPINQLNSPLPQRLTLGANP